MLRQNFLLKLLDLPKSSRFFLLLLTVTLCSVGQTEPGRLSQMFVNRLGTPPSTESATSTVKNFSFSIPQSNVEDNENASEDDVLASESREYTADGKYYYIIREYFDGRIRKFGPNPTE